ncbi:MAG: ribonuclease HII [Lachnospiraceae bacterium]|nr:ribonuclease HII [Lachnospiraceae bacterium]
MSEKSIKQIQSEYKETADEKLDSFIREYIQDGRPGVAKLINQAQRKIMKLQQEKARVLKMTEYEKKYSDYEYICGIDEVGRGPLAGPTVAGAVILPKDLLIYYINDSKKLSETKREKLFDEIKEKAIASAVGIVDVDSINKTDNISVSVYEAMRQAIGNLNVKPDLLFVDAVHIPDIDIKQVSIVKGDAKSISIAAASIIAKVTRDRMMVELDEKYPGYGFKDNKGYGTKEHIDGLKRLGKSPIHRDKFIRNFIEE